MMEVHKLTTMVPMSAEAYAEAKEAAASFQRFMNATPEQRAEWARDAQERRRAERAAATLVPLTLDALLDKLGFDSAYAEHLVQSYCTCGDGRDGWDYCQHARDLGLVP